MVNKEMMKNVEKNLFFVFFIIKFLEKIRDFQWISKGKEIQGNFNITYLKNQCFFIGLVWEKCPESIEIKNEKKIEILLFFSKFYAELVKFKIFLDFPEKPKKN